MNEMNENTNLCPRIILTFQGHTLIFSFSKYCLFAAKHASTLSTYFFYGSFKLLLLGMGEKSIFFDFLSIRPVLSIIDKKPHLSIKNRFCLELQKN